MAKRPAMGKGLSSLLGSASANRRDLPEADQEQTAEKQQDHVGQADTGSTVSAAQGTEPDTTESIKIQADTPIVLTAEATEADPSETRPEVGAVNQSKPEGRLVQLSIDRIRRGVWQPRKQFDQAKLQELADSIRVQGLIQPLLVRPFADGYEIIAGERRWRAAQLAGLHEVPAIIRDMDDQSSAAVSLIENIQRADLNPMEEAQALQRLQQEFGMKHQEIAEAVGRSRTAVTNLLRLMELDEAVKVHLEKGEIDMGHARALLALDKNQQREVAKQIITRGLSVRATEALVRQTQKAPTSRSATEVRRDPNIVALEKDLSDKFGASVSIESRHNGGGKLHISYSSNDELQGILERIR